jgi:spermidine synthase
MDSQPPAEPEPAAPPSPSPTRRAYVELFLISFVALFLELACIRWFGATVAFLTFFTNLVLMACFLGLSVGLMAASSRRDYSRLTLPVGLVGAIIARWVLDAHQSGGAIMVEVGGRGSPQQVYFGTEYLVRDPFAWAVPIEAMAGFFFVLIAVMFIGIGQIMGRRFNAIPDRVRAYSADVGGSIAGIVAFGVASRFESTPLLWFAVGAGLFAMLMRRRSALQVACLVGLVYVAALSAFGPGQGQETLWSPYYKVEYDPKLKLIETNNIGHQQMVDVETTGRAYQLPHLLNQAGGGSPFKDVLIIGAGSGNDVAAALRAGAERVDAVEIDPTLQRLGRRDHPNRPYDDPRVAVHLTDGRGFLRTTDTQYDLIIYALVDSLVLHSGYSSLRLESFLFTDQAMRDIRARLKPGGVFAAYNYYRQGWVVGRIDLMISDAFGSPPVVFSLPPQDVIRPTESQSNHITFLMASNGPNPAIEAARDRFAGGEVLVTSQDADSRAWAGTFAPRDDAPGDALRPAEVITEGIAHIPTDSWPFLYLRDKVIPSLNIRGMAIVGVLSLALLLAFAPTRGVRGDAQMFFLGAGFMLLETKGVVHMALLFGATWAVNSIVFGAILVMILLANLFVVLARPSRQWPYYAGLILALLANVLVPLETYLALPGAVRVVVSCAVVFLPVLFAGIVFAMAFRDRARPDLALGANIAGVVVGGLSENLSLGLGFNNLIWVAVAFYLLSALLRSGRGAMTGP